MMTKRFMALICVAFLASAADAAVKKGENLVANGGFDAEQGEFPDCWNPSPKANVIYNRTEGPSEKKAAVCLKNVGNEPVTVTFRQQGIILVPGEKYKLSAYIKTENYKSEAGGVVVHNDGWAAAVGFDHLPANSNWTFREQTFTMIPSPSKEYGLAVFAKKLVGNVCFADIKLEALGEKACQGSVSQMAVALAPRLIPMRPLLNKIPQTKAELSLRLYGNLPEKVADYECLAAVVGNPIPAQTIQFEKDNNIRVNLTGLPRGDYSLKAVVRDRKTRKSAIEVSYPISIIDAPTIDGGKIKHLNNLVAEVLNQPLEKTSSPQSFTFTNPRDGWIFVTLADGHPAANVTVTVDGGDKAITADRLEAFRRLSAGQHRLCITGEPGDARLIVRSIPEILDYPPCRDSLVAENGSYGWEFMKKHVLCAATTFDGGVMPGKALSEAKDRGLKWLASFRVNPIGDPAELARRMEKSPGMTDPQYNGLTVDEIYFERNTIDNYAKALRLLHNPRNRLIYTWIVGKPAIHASHTDFLSAAMNVSGGRGRLLYEAYCRPMADEKAAAAYLDDMIGEHIRQFNAFFPGANAGLGIIFGNFNQIPIASIDFNPAVDYKYYLDMQINLIANNPEFMDIAATGYWGTYYGDEEMVRWSFMLMRHYAVEGRRDMLSNRYGFKYNPGFLKNCDFVDGLKCWDCEPAANGSIRAEKISGYGTHSQGRLFAANIGDNVCLMTRMTGKCNRISQTANDLKVGKVYCLQFATADYDDVVGKKYNPRQYGVNAELKGAKIIPDKSYVHVDKRKNNNNLGKVNINRIVFRATSPTQTIAFSDEKALPGEKLVINFVQLRPYLE